MNCTTLQFGLNMLVSLSGIVLCVCSLYWQKKFRQLKESHLDFLRQQQEFFRSAEGSRLLHEMAQNLRDKICVIRPKDGSPHVVPRLHNEDIAEAVIQYDQVYDEIMRRLMESWEQKTESKPC